MTDGFEASLDLRLLPAFLALAQESHFSRAAQRLRITQPALSQQISRLERQIGARLFDRPPRAVALTEAGRALLGHVAPALALIEQGVAQSRTVVGGPSFALNVCHLSSFAARLVPRIVAALRAGDPHLRLTLHQASLPEQLAALRAGRAHVGLIHASPDLPLQIPDLEAETIATGPRMIALPEDHPLAKSEHVTLSDAASEPFVLPSGDARSGYSASVRGACARYGFAPSVALQANDTGVMLDLVSAGAGVALVPWITIDALPDGVVVRPLANEKCSVVALFAQHAPDAVAALIGAARDAMEQLPPVVGR
ncbi:MAG TPA: LysR substrate-binding domain-containing protein [Actinocrinis sp.]|jgi:DNA-binding transcriptional LysR family regulator|nr:LysR substrate-binding domain-containing protein [Actinocrinis sp.]